jgi:L-asparaginase II
MTSKNKLNHCEICGVTFWDNKHSKICNNCSWKHYGLIGKVFKSINDFSKYILDSAKLIISRLS